MKYDGLSLFEIIGPGLFERGTHSVTEDVNAKGHLSLWYLLAQPFPDKKGIETFHELHEELGIPEDAIRSIFGYGYLFSRSNNGRDFNMLFQHIPRPFVHDGMTSGADYSDFYSISHSDSGRIASIKVKHGKIKSSEVSDNPEYKIPMQLFEEGRDCRGALEWMLKTYINNKI